MSATATLVAETEIVDRTREWIRENFLYMRPDWTLRDNDEMVGSGVIDSVGVIELVEFLQGAFGIEVADAEITVSNLGSLNAIGRYIYAKCRLGTGTERRSRQVA
jgi:acyl carrier protein